jgi:diguanylate cyclase (GGDEF)-like protein
MPETQRRPIGLHLAWLLSVGGASIFVTVLIVATGDLATLWPLYIVPIVIAALAYEVAGAVVAVAACAALVALLMYAAGLDTVVLPSLVVGAVAYSVSGVVIGLQAHSYRRQRDLLQVDSIRDPLTSAFNAEHLKGMLAEELRRADRYGLECSFAVVQVIGFEEIRRTYGRVRAEQLLCRLLDIVRLCVRDTDVVGRSGHDSFGIILPLTGADASKLVTDRIEAAVRGTEFEGDALEPTIRCPVAIAHAVCPEDSCEPEAVMAMVEQRLLQATCTVQPERAPQSGAEPALPDALA